MVLRFAPLLLITLAALVFRCTLLDKDDFWIDEALSAQYASWPIGEIVERLGNASAHPPFYFLLLHYWQNIFGSSEFALRFLSVIFGVLTVPAVAILGYRLYGGMAGYFSGMLLCLSPFHLHYSQEARPYALMLFLTTISFLAFVALLKNPSRAVKWVYVCATTLLVYTHYYGLFAVATQNIHYLFMRKRDREEANPISLLGWTTLQIWIVGLFLPWLSFFIGQVGRTSVWSWIRDPNWYSLVNIALQIGNRDAVLTVALLLTALPGLLWVISNGDGRRKGPGMVPLWLFTPLIAALAVSKLYAPILWGRYLMQSFLSILLLAARGLSLVFALGWLGYAFGILLVLAHIAPLSDYYTKPQRTAWRAALAHIEKHAAASDYIYYPDLPSVARYYFTGPRRQFTFTADRESCLQAMEARCASGTKVWAIIVAWPGMWQQKFDAFEEFGFERAQEAPGFEEFRDLFVVQFTHR